VHDAWDLIPKALEQALPSMRIDINYPQAQSLLADFGLNPTASTRVVVPGKQKKNVFADL
jgi:hypothetical protein